MSRVNPGDGWSAILLFVLRRFRRSGRDIVYEIEPDGALINLARLGDLDAFNELVNRYRSTVYSIAYRYMRSPDLADDVTQDTFLRAYNALSTFRNPEGKGFRSWLLTIAANRSRDMLRAQGRRPADSLEAMTDAVDTSWEPENPSETPIEYTERGDLSAQLEWALGEISDDQRLVIILSDVHGHSYEEIAEIIGVAVGTVKSRIHRGRARLREIILDDEEARELFEDQHRLVSDGA